MIAVSTIASRQHLHDRLARAFPGARFFIDVEGNATANYLRALQGAPTINGWKVVLEDDAIPADGLAQALPLILRAAPAEADVLGLYNNHFNPASPGLRPYHHNMLPTVAIAVREEIVPDLCELVTALVGDWEMQFRNNYDRAMMLVLSAFGRVVYVAQPSLVDHDHLQPSTLGHPATPGGRIRVGPNFDIGGVKVLLKELYAGH